MNAEIYYVEDDPNIAESVKEYLEQRELSVTIIASLSRAKEILLKKQPDMILIDWNLPDGNGITLCEWVRKRFGKGISILFLTVKGETPEIVQGFQRGADDYLVKPFELEVLYSRILAVLRRMGKEESETLFCDKICLDKKKMTAYLEEKEISLTALEYRVLLYLLEQKGRTVTRQKLLEEIWDMNGNYVNDNTLTVTMKRLREKFQNPSCIKTVRSFGYRMEDTI